MRVQLSSDDQNHIIATAHRLADAARFAILPHFRTSLTAQNKDASGYDPVTIADRAAEQAMREILAELRPQDGIIGEEFGTSQGQSGIDWILDPIDGTRAFICGAPTWGVLIGVAIEGHVVYGIVDQPHIGERFEGGFGRAQLSGPHGEMALATRAARPLDQSVIMTTFPEVGTASERACFEHLAQRCLLVRYGMDCYAYMLLALGQIDYVMEAGLNSYDIAGPIGVIEAAGGVVRSWSGCTAVGGGRVLAASNQEMLDQALRSLAPVLERDEAK